MTSREPLKISTYHRGYYAHRAIGLIPRDIADKFNPVFIQKSDITYYLHRDDRVVIITGIPPFRVKSENARLGTVFPEQVTDQEYRVALLDVFSVFENEAQTGLEEAISRLQFIYAAITEDDEEENNLLALQQAIGMYLETKQKLTN